MSFSSQVSHSVACSALKNRGLYPVSVSASLTPHGEPFDNYNTCLYIYHVYYCLAEGITRVHSLARDVLLYLFHGTYKTGRGRDAPVITMIHKGCQNSYRIMRTIEKDFKPILSLLTSKKKTYDPYLTDMGKNKAPNNYLVAWEESLRNAAMNK